MLKPLAWPSPGEDECANAGPLEAPVAGDVHLWAADLDASEYGGLAPTEVLSAAERDRADRFHFAVHRQRFISGHLLLRCLLAGYLRTDPCDVAFAAGPNGKPGLQGRLAGSKLEFNLSHCENIALFGFTRGQRIGVDVERVRALEEMSELVTRFFSPGESARFQQLDPSERPGAFFNLWTRKEAWLKATGEGIGRHLHRVEVSFLPGEPVGLAHLPADLGQARDWTLFAGSPAADYVSAAAVEAAVRRVRCWAVPPEWVLSRLA